jgi:hypothetical protein
MIKQSMVISKFADICKKQGRPTEPYTSLYFLTTTNAQTINGADICKT